MYSYSTEAIWTHIASMAMALPMTQWHYVYTYVKVI